MKGWDEVDRVKKIGREAGNRGGTPGAAVRLLGRGTDMP